MELDAVTLSTIVGAVVTGVVGALGASKLRKGPRTGEDHDGKPDESLVPRSAVAMEGRLVRMEGKLDAVLEGQRQHSADDERRFKELEKELQDTRHDLKDRIAPLPLVSARVDRLEEDLRITRRQLSLDSSVHDVRGGR